MPSPNPVSRLLVVSRWIAKGMLHPDHSRQSNGCLLMQAPSDTNRVNITQLQTMSNTFLSCRLGLTQTHRAPLPGWQLRDRLCLRSDLPSSPRALRPWPRCVGPDVPAKVGQTWQVALIYSHLEIKEGEALTLNMTNEGALILRRCREQGQDVCLQI